MSGVGEPSASAIAAANAPKLEDDELRILLPHTKERGYAKNSVIINEGDTSDTIYIIISGRVKVYLRNADGREVTLNVHGPGEYFGEMAIDGGPRTASVVTLEACKFLTITKSDFKNLLSSNPDFALRLINRLTHRLRAMNVNIRNLALLDVYGRVARLLLELATDQEGKLVIAQKLTQQDIAERVGASREMISRIFKDLVTGGYVSVDHQLITINRDLPARR
jgi:CRP/FNR family transcriptional regulator, cyclic AMP receptor protein